MAFSFRDEYPILGPNAVIDDAGVVSATNSGINGGSQPSKAVGAWVEHVGLPVVAQAINQTVYVATYPVRLLQASARFSVVGGAAFTVTAFKDPSGTALGGGTALLAAPIALTGTTNTNTLGAVVAGAAPTLAAGDSISLVFAGTPGSFAGAVDLTLQKV